MIGGQIKISMSSPSRCAAMAYAPRQSKNHPCLWAMCAHLHTSYTYIILSDTDVEYIHTIHTFNTEQHLSTLYSQSYGSMLR